MVAGYSMLDAGYWMLDTRYWMLDARYWMLDARYWMLDTRYWMLDAGHWSLAAGPFLSHHWILAPKRQHRNIICLAGGIDMGKKTCFDPCHEFRCGRHGLR